jgi:hypothetical protein
MRHINRRVPLLVLEPFIFLNRLYKKGQILDQRRVDIRQRRIRQFIEEGKVVLCVESNSAILKEHGWVYRSKARRNPIEPIDKPPQKEPYSFKKDSDDILSVLDGDETIGTLEKIEWTDTYNAFIDDKIVNNKPLILQKALRLVTEIHKNKSR